MDPVRDEVLCGQTQRVSLTYNAGAIIERQREQI